MCYQPDIKQSLNLDDREWRAADEGLRLAYSLLLWGSIEARSFLESGNWCMDS